MADITPTTPTPSGKKKIPTWYWLAGGGALVAAYLLWKRSTAASTAATTAAAQSAQSADSGTAAGSYGNAGDLSALAPYLQNLQGTASATTGTTTTSGVAWTAPTGETLRGSGYVLNVPGVGDSTAPITDAAGNSYTYITTPDQLNQITASGGTDYVQVLPGVFTPAGPAGSLAAGTPQYAKTGGTGAI
jgi:hypothetical protein